MATAIIPIVAQVAPMLVAELPKIVSMLENIFKRPKSGTDKMDVALRIARIIVDKLGATGEVTGKAPTDEALQAMIEVALADMKSKGSMDAKSSDDLFLLRGVVQRVTFKDQV
jgi:hypothetical protein